jgi:hypothetical protein
MSNLKSVRVLLFTLPLLTSCGSANFNKIFGSKDDSYASLLQRAQLAYDVGDFSKAETLANKAYARSDNNGDAGVLLGSVYLSQAGIDIFQLVGKLSTLSASKTSTAATSSDKCTTTAASSQSAGNLLAELSCKILSLSDSDKAALGSDVVFSGLSSLGVPSVYVPNEVNDTLRAKVSVLAALDKGIRKLCPFIDRTLVISQSIDERHTSADICPDHTSTSFNNVKAHISFALLHLVESLVFQQGLLTETVSASGGTSARTGIAGVSSTINSATFTTAASLATALTDFKKVVDSVADTANPKAQIALALNGFIVVSQSFTAAGVPASVTSVITKQLTKLKATAATLKGTSTGSDSTYQSKALKGQLNEKYAKTMTTKINDACPTAASCSSTDITALCASYTGISDGTDPAKVTKPTVCQ